MQLKLLTLVFIISISSTLSYSQSLPNVIEESRNIKYSVFEATINGKPAIGTINYAFTNFSHKQEYPWCLRISIALKDTIQNGMPSDKETARADMFENELINLIQRVSRVQYVSHYFSAGQLNIFTYINKSI